MIRSNSGYQRLNKHAWKVENFRVAEGCTTTLNVHLLYTIYTRAIF